MAGVWIHVADPTRFVPLGSPLETEARHRGSSVYLPTGLIPMFPLSIAAGPLSLREDQPSCALSFGVVLDADGAINADYPPLITPSLVRARRLTYGLVDQLLRDPFADWGAEDGTDVPLWGAEPSSLLWRLG